jgi:hypothetical protein
VDRVRQYCRRRLSASFASAPLSPSQSSPDSSSSSEASWQQRLFARDCSAPLLVPVGGGWSPPVRVDVAVAAAAEEGVSAATDARLGRLRRLLRSLRRRRRVLEAAALSIRITTDLFDDGGGCCCCCSTWWFWRWRWRSSSFSVVLYIISYLSII